MMEPYWVLNREHFARVRETMRALEQTHRMKILFAVESGSRAWGFASPDSDWDVRFVYARPTADYLALSEPRDVIEHADGDLDVSGWDARKALRLLLKGNATLREWLTSPIIYVNRGAIPLWSALAEQVPKRRAIAQGYRSIMYNCWRQYLEPDKAPEAVPLKKYFYVLRPALALRYMRENPTAAHPPMSMQDLIDGTTPGAALLTTIQHLIATKRAHTGGEKMLHPRIAVLDDLVTAELGMEDSLPGDPPDQETPSDVIADATALFQAAVDKADRYFKPFSEQLSRLADQ